MGWVTVIILAAGQGKRMNSSIQKQYLHIKDKPVLYYSLQAFQQSRADEIILVTGKDEITYCKEQLVGRYGFTKVTAVTEGGKERYHSVYQGLKQIQKTDGYVLIHDGARPLITEAIIDRCIDGAKAFRACAAGMPVKDTIKIVDEENFADYTPKRSDVWMIQTPQAFYYPLIRQAYDSLMENEMPVTDDAMVMENFGDVKVKMVQGSYENIKITTPEDLSMAEVFLDRIKK